MKPFAQQLTKLTITSLLEKVRQERYLFRAWDRVRARARRSPSAPTRRAVQQFDEHAYRNLRRIATQLREDRFTFAPSRGVPIARPGKAPRPIVVQRIEDRIVQRSLLDVLMGIPTVRSALECSTSFGGLPGKGVPGAVRLAVDFVAAGHGQYYVRSDIADFFSNIPRLTALTKLRELLPDTSLDAFLDQATAVELENQSELGQLMDYYPDEITGVVQGHCLSAMLGNLLLSSFDEETNARECLCIRYLDDFLILGPDSETVSSVFATGQEILSNFGLEAYRPGDSDKADQGNAQKSFDFLGCELSRGFVRPSVANRKKLLNSVRERLEASSRLMISGGFGSKQNYRRSLVATLSNIADTLQAWSEQYSFCNYTQIQRRLDRKIDKMLSRYIGTYSNRKSRVDNKQRRRMLGLWLLSDAESDPFLGSS